MGTGHSVHGQGVCKGVCLVLPGMEVVDDFLPLELGSSNVILGMQWLHTLGTTMVNWSTLTMKFRVGMTSLTLQGVPTLAKMPVSFKSLVRTVWKERGSVLIELGALGISE